MGRICLLVSLLLGGLLLLAMATSPGEGVAVVAVETREGSMCRIFPQSTIFPHVFPSSNMSSVGMCVLARPEITQPLNPSTIFSFSSNFVTVTAGIDSLALRVMVGEELFPFNQTLNAEAWNMVCVGLSAGQATPTPKEEDATPQSYQVWASLHGRLLEVPLATIVTELENVNVCVGSNGLSFTGLVTGVSLRVGEGDLTPPNCSVLLQTNEVTVPLNDFWSTRGPVFVVEEQLHQPCDAPVHTLVLQETWDYYNFHRFCRSLGGRFPTEVEAATDQVLTLNCTSWTSDDSVKEEGPTARCPIMLAGGGVGLRRCLTELECSLCQVPAGLRYTLFGPRTDFDRYYNLRTLPGGRYDFQGETSSFHHEASGWTLQSTLHSKKLHLNNSAHLMGRHTWHSRGRGHSADTLTFTVCNAIQFSSDDGVCLLRSERCDGLVDSPDKSDEEGCGSRRLLGRDASYDTSVRPFRGQEQPLVLNYVFHTYVIEKMSTEKGTATLELALDMDWEDERIMFTDLKMRENFFPCEDIWTPTFTTIAGYEKGPKVNLNPIRNTCWIYWTGTPTQKQQLDDPLMGRYLSKANIMLHFNFVVTYPCLLRVSEYPFGRYMCNVSFSLVGTDKHVDWKAISSDQVVHYELGDDLFDYRLEKITVEEHEPWVTLTLHLMGQPANHMINSFLPSSLMFVICYSSFFFPIVGFNERIMASLTSLLVLVALFSQATNSYVRTPYYKLIDVWYVALMLLCFTIVIANGIVNYLRVQKVKSHSGLMKKVTLAKRFNLGSQTVIMSLFLLLMFIFVLFSNNAI